MLLLIAGFLLAGTGSTALENRFYRKQHFGEFKGIAMKIADWNRRFGKENITNTIAANGPFYIHYYLDRMEPDIRFAQYDNRTGEDLLALTRMVDSASTDWFAHANTKPAPPEILMIIQEKFPCLAYHKDYDGLSEIWLFSKHISDSCIQPAEPAKRFFFTFDDENLGGGNPKFLDSTIFASPPYSYYINEHSIYGPGIKIKIGEDIPVNVRKAEMEISAFSPVLLHEMPIVFNIESSDGNSYFWRSMRIENFITPGKWGKAHFNSELPTKLQQGDNIRIFIWNLKQERIWVDDFEVRFY